MALTSSSNDFGLGDGIGPESFCGMRGGGSIMECAGDFATTTDSGSAAIVSSAEDVSMVIFFVTGGAFRGV